MESHKTPEIEVDFITEKDRFVFIQDTIREVYSRKYYDLYEKNNVLVFFLKHNKMPVKRMEISEK